MKQKQSYYECHITIEAPLEKRKVVRELVESYQWSYSEHDEDHEIGPGLRCYANKSYKASEPADFVIDQVKVIQSSIHNDLLVSNSGVVARYKVEFVLFDVVTEALTTSGSHLQSRRNTRFEDNK